MILEIDAGNTFIKWRQLDGGEVAFRGKFFTKSESWDLPSVWSKAVCVRIASVAGADVNHQLRVEVEKLCGQAPHFAATSAEAAGVVNSYADASRMGVDRWLVMLAAYNECNQACCIVDCGSAITVDYISATGQHQGGYIIPGLRLMSGALLQNTSEIIVDEDLKGFSLVPGTDTSSAVTHGVNFLFNSVCQKVCDELLRSEEQYALFVTGGDGELFCKLTGQGQFKPDLVMDGLSWSVP